jgi:hypothetical protein
VQLENEDISKNENHARTLSILMHEDVKKHFTPIQFKNVLD